MKDYREIRKFRNEGDRKNLRPITISHTPSEMSITCNRTYPGQSTVEKDVFGPLLPQVAPENFDNDFYKLFLKFETPIKSLDDSFTFPAAAWTLKFGFTFDNVVSAPPDITQLMHVRLVVADWDPDTITQSNMPLASLGEILTGETLEYETSSFTINSLNVDYEMWTDRLDLLNAMANIEYSLTSVVSPTVFNFNPFPSAAPSVNALVGKRIVSNYDTAKGIRTIVSNTGSQLTVDSAFNTLPTAFTFLQIERMLYGAVLYAQTNFPAPYPRILAISDPILVRHGYVS